MHAARHHAANAGNKLRFARHGDDAGGGADHVHGIALADVRADRVPVRVKCAHGNGYAGTQPQRFSPLRRKMPGQMIAGQELAAKFGAHAGKQRVHGHQKLLRRQPAPLGIPHPLVAHGADAALQLVDLGDAAKRSRHHVAMFQRGDKLRALFGIVAQPVQQLCEPPLVGVDAAAPRNAFKAQRMRLLRNLFGLGKGAMIAPEVIIVQRFQALAHRNHARSGRVQRDCCNRVAIHAGALERISGRRRECCHLVLMRLGGKVRVLAPAVQRIGCRRRTDRSLLAVHKSYANAECAKVNPGDDRHGNSPSGKRFLIRKPEYTIP